MKIRTFLALIVTGLAFSACNDHKNTSADSDDAFPRKDMLSNIATNLVTPSLQDFQTKTASLYALALTFTASPSQGSLDSLQTALDSTFVSWQYCSWFRYGSASTYFGVTDGTVRHDDINTFPVSTSNIESYIAAGDLNLDSKSEDTRGLNTVDYLINPAEGVGDTAILNQFSSANRKAYLLTVILRLKTRAESTNAAWTTEKADFIASDGKDAASSVSQLVLYWDVDYENIKNYKVGIPVGRILKDQTLAPLPNEVEALYNGQSIRYIRHNFTAIKNLWYGRSRAGGEGLGFDDYLYDREAGDVATDIVQQFNAIQAKLDALPQGRLSDIIQTNKQPVQDLYTELLKLTHLVKTNMVSSLSLSITYNSGDGD